MGGYRKIIVENRNNRKRSTFFAKNAKGSPPFPASVDEIVGRVSDSSSVDGKYQPGVNYNAFEEGVRRSIDEWKSSSVNYPTDSQDPVEMKLYAQLQAWQKQRQYTGNGGNSDY
ncbi:MAG: hypothetical protein ACOCQX_03385 [Candidatus Nanoarchaeia archaeon]